MEMKSNRVDPSNLISKLGPFVSRATGAPFRPNEPSDASEVIFWGFYSHWNAEMLPIILQCFLSLVLMNWEFLWLMRLILSLCRYVIHSLCSSPQIHQPLHSEFFSSSSLTGVNQRFYGVCDSNQDGTSVIQLFRPPQIRIVQRWWWLN